MSERTIIGVFCYKRAGKLKASMEALLQNPECATMDIVFFCDGHKGERDYEGVMETRAYIDSLTGFRNIYKHYRERNISTGPNFKQGITWLCENYDQFIVVEDDLVVTPNYIKYLLDALDFYKHDPSIFCVTGFAFPLQKGAYPFDTIIHRRFCSYGWGAWSNRVAKVIWDKDELSGLMEGPQFKKRLDREGHDLYRMLKKQISGAISTWDIQMQVHVAQNDLKVVYPVLSKTHNIGFDNESTNTFGVDYLKTVTDPGDQRTFNFCPADREDLPMQKQLRKPYQLPALASRKIINTVIKLTNTVKKS
jgi:hypothetical protein